MTTQFIVGEKIVEISTGRTGDFDSVELYPSMGISRIRWKPDDGKTDWVLSPVADIEHYSAPKAGTTEEEENFADHPDSLALKRAQSSNDARKWGPRDALIHVLKKLDAGDINPYACIIIYAEKEKDGIVGTSYILAGPDRLTTLGLMQETIHSMAEGD